LQEFPKPKGVKLTLHKQEHSPEAEANLPRFSDEISTLVHESADADLEMRMIKMCEQTGKKLKYWMQLFKRLKKNCFYKFANKKFFIMAKSLAVNYFMMNSKEQSQQRSLLMI
jgi:hypothetical protein